MITKRVLETIKTQGPISYDRLINQLEKETGYLHTPIVFAIMDLETKGDIVSLPGNKMFYVNRASLS